MFTIPVIFRSQNLYRYYKAYLQFRHICDKLEIAVFEAVRKLVVYISYRQLRLICNSIHSLVVRAAML